MLENEEEATAVYARKVHKGASDEVNRVIFEQTSEVILKSLSLGSDDGRVQKAEAHNGVADAGSGVLK